MSETIGFFLKKVWIFIGYFLDILGIVVTFLKENGEYNITENPQKVNKIYHFGEFRLDSAERRLWCKSEPISLTPKQFDLLFYFVENAGRTAKKGELLDAIWADIYIEETTLARNVSWLRQKLAEYSKGESFIETVPKLGYRFTAEVKHSDENFLIIEEQTIQHIRGQEIIRIEDTELTKNKKTKSAKSFAASVLLILLVMFGLLGGGYFLYENNKKSVALPTASNPPSLNARPPINIGSIVHLQNRYPNDGSYLDAWGVVWSKPEFKQVPTEIMFVSTHDNPNRENGSGSWEIVSANGKNKGEPLAVGDKIHLKNMYPNAGYLDACGWVEHLRVFEKFSDQTGAVFTTKSPNRENGTGIWIIRSATEKDGTPILEGDSIALESTYFINDKGKNRIAGFLNVTGKVKDIPAYNDYDGSKLVFTQNISYNQPILDIWTITNSKAISK
jgi:DNA-binding winged helix-turn-helix (wHTH) protein